MYTLFIYVYTHWSRLICSFQVQCCYCLLPWTTHSFWGVTLTTSLLYLYIHFICSFHKFINYKCTLNHRFWWFKNQTAYTVANFWEAATSLSYLLWGCQPHLLLQLYIHSYIILVSFKTHQISSNRKAQIFKLESYKTQTWESTCLEKLQSHQKSSELFKIYK